MKRRATFLVVLMEIVLISAPSTAEILYNITAIGSTDWGTVAPYSINDMGQVAGIFNAGTAQKGAFLWDSENGITDLGTLGGDWSEARGINNNGQVVGRSANIDGKSHVFLWEDGIMSNLGTLGTEWSIPYGINNNGQIVGYSNDIGFVWDSASGMTDLGTLGGSFSIAYSINDIGQVVGRSENTNGNPHAFLWEDGVMSDLGTLGGRSSKTLDINETGQAVGLSDTGIRNYYHAFLWDNANGITDLGTLGGDFSEAYAINNDGQVIGDSDVVGDPADHAFLYKDGEMLDLNNLISPSSGWLLTHAQNINSSGQIVGNGIFGGEGRAFLLTPIPEPATILLFGLGALILRRKHR